MRTAPPEVPPVVCGNYRVEAPIWSGPGRNHNGGYLEVYEASSRRPLFRLELYRPETPPDGHESDVFDVFIKSMQMEGPVLVVKDEEGRCFHVDLEARSFQSRPSLAWEVRLLVRQNRIAEACDRLLSSSDTGYSLESQQSLFRNADRPEAALMSRMLLDWGPPSVFGGMFLPEEPVPEGLHLPHNGWAAAKIRQLSEAQLTELRQQMGQLSESIDLDGGTLQPAGLEALPRLFTLLALPGEDPVLQTAICYGQHILSCLQYPNSYMTTESESVARLALWLDSLSQLLAAP